jgi:hypothetical protein
VLLPTKGLYLAACQEPSRCCLKPHRCLEFLLCLLLVAVEHHNELIPLLFEPSECIWSEDNLKLIPGVMDLRSMGIVVFSGEVIPLCRRLGSRVAALGA